MAVIHDTLGDAVKLYRDLVKLQARYGSDPDVVDSIRCLARLIKDLRSRIIIYDHWSKKCPAISSNSSQ